MENGKLLKQMEKVRAYYVQVMNLDISVPILEPNS
jgi:hypothetical protein